MGTQPDRPPLSQNAEVTGGLLFQVRRATGRLDLRAVGDVDLNSRGVWHSAMASLTGGGDDVHLDLSDLTFIDAHGTSLLATTAIQLGGDRRMVLHRPPQMLLRVLELCWPTLSSIEAVAR
jgi:anti-anti-sigma factor